MHAFWVILGIVVLGIGFLDVFLTILNYDESGFLATPGNASTHRHAAAMRPKRPLLKSVTACWISSSLFITNGP
jgi:hypothetical protein